MVRTDFLIRSLLRSCLVSMNSKMCSALVVETTNVKAGLHEVESVSGTESGADGVLT